MGSKFYKDGHQQLMQEAIPRVVALADAVLLKEKEFLGALTDIQRQALQAILFSDDPQEKLAKLAEETMSMPEIMIDEINDVATQFLDDILVDTFDDTPTVLEQYADELKRAVELLGVE